jgi:hypothetical protein
MASDSVDLGTAASEAVGLLPISLSPFVRFMVKLKLLREMSK